MSQNRRTLKTLTAGLLLALPLAAGAGYAAVTETDIQSAWNSGEDPSAAPSAVDQSALIDARRAAGEAGSQAGFMASGTEKLAAGTKQLDDGAKELSDGAIAARDGAQQLSDGMTQLQAATGQLGTGATKVADGVSLAVDNVLGLEVVRGQILTSIDMVLSDIRTNNDPQVAQFRGQLEDFRRQVEGFTFDQSLTAQLRELKDGSREIANQLGTPGYGFHDGIYTATSGANELAAGLNALTDGVDEAMKGVDDLNNGAQQLNTMAGQTQQKVDAISRALPVGAASTDAGDAGRTFAPMYAFLIAAGVLLGAITRGRSKVATVITVLALSALTGLLFVLLGTGVPAGLGFSAAGIGALLAVAAMFGTSAAIRAFGPTVGTSLSALFAVIQAGIVGWVWNSAATAEVSTGMQALANLMPLNYPTVALTSLGNNGDALLTWGSTGILAALAVCAVVSAKLVPSRVSND